jgi:hypothetical protein
MAQPGELVLLEQPELHLHPGPQQVLGDFFLGLIETGRQLIVETHSEYLVNRLRLRIAEDEYGAVQDAVSLLYARRSDGETSFSQIPANRYGSLEVWPEGFFDQSPLEAEAIIRAAAQKRRRKDEDRSPASTGERVEVYAEYQGQRVEALFDPATESITMSWAPLNGQVFGSPSGAAIAVVSELNPDVSPNRNGWTFWTVVSSGAPLGSIRK